MHPKKISEISVDDQYQYYFNLAWFWHDQIKNSHHNSEKKRCKNLSIIYSQCCKDLKKSMS